MHSVLLEESYLFCLSEAAKKFDATTHAIRQYLYPSVEANLSKSSTMKAYRKCVSEFISRRSTQMYDSLPCSRILFGESDAQELYAAVGVNKGEITEAILKTYWGNEPHFSPLAAKDECTILMLCIIKYFLGKNQKKDAELAMIHLAFSGKFYPSLHYRSFPDVVPARHIMEYTVNNVLTVKYDLVSEGSVMGAVRKVGNTWMDTYKNRFKTFEDEDIKGLIDQLLSRIGSFIKNIATEYYKVWQDRDDLYIAYASDSLEDDDFHMADSDSLKSSRIADKAINYMINNGVDYSICNQCSDTNITTNEVKSIMESIFGDPQQIVKVRELVMLMVVTYMTYGNGNKDVRSPKFITYTIAPKPNAKQKELVRIQELVTELLCENSPAFVRRRSRPATKNSFERALKMYFALSIHNANR